MKMSWSIGAAVAIGNAVLAFVLAVLVGFALMKVLNIHDREGGGSMGIFFVYGPFAAALGLVWGLVATGIVGATAWSQAGRAFALAQLFPNALVLSFLALKVITRPVAPTIDGMALDLEAEVLVPEGLFPEASIRHQHTRASLYAGETDNQFITVQRDRIELRDGVWVVPLRGRLNTKSTRRMLTYVPYEQVSLTLDMRLRSIPFEDDTAWSEVQSMRKDLLPDGTMVASGVSARYRVVKVPR
jgi:hypothetical protein